MICVSDIRQDDMDHIDIQALSSHLRQRMDAVWDNLDICPRSPPTKDSRLRTYNNFCAVELVCWACRSCRLQQKWLIQAATSPLNC